MYRIVATMLGAAALATPALAQEQAGGGFAQRDQTRAEVQQRAERLFQMMDANHDGVVTRQEAEQAAQLFAAQSGGQSNRIERMIEQAFANRSSLSLDQFEAPLLARFDAMDLNHDGVVTVAEREQYRAQRRSRSGIVRPNGAATPGTATPDPTGLPEPHQI